jgi:hypothetical protein
VRERTGEAPQPRQQPEQPLLECRSCQQSCPNADETSGDGRLIPDA